MTETFSNGTQASSSQPATAIAIAPPVKKNWVDQIPLAVATGLIALMFTIGTNFGGRISTTTDKTIELNAIVQQISEDIKDQKTEAKEARAFQAQILVKVTDVYTRSEARQDREESMRRFAELTSQITTLTGRLDRTDNTIRMMQDQMKIMQEMILNRNAGSNTHR